MKRPKNFIGQLKIREIDSQSWLLRDELRAMSLDSWVEHRWLPSSAFLLLERYLILQGDFGIC